MDEYGDAEGGGIVLAFYGEKFDVEVPAGEDDGEFVEEGVNFFGVYSVICAIRGRSRTGCSEPADIGSRSRMS